MSNGAKQISTHLFHLLILKYKPQPAPTRSTSSQHKQIESEIPQTQIRRIKEPRQGMATHRHHQILVQRGRRRERTACEQGLEGAGDEELSIYVEDEVHVSCLLPSYWTGPDWLHLAVCFGGKEEKRREIVHFQILFRHIFQWHPWLLIFITLYIFVLSIS